VSDIEDDVSIASPDELEDVRGAIKDVRDAAAELDEACAAARTCAQSTSFNS
jgi:hypothetical protein